MHRHPKVVDAVVAVLVLAVCALLALACWASRQQELASAHISEQYADAASHGNMNRVPEPRRMQ